MVPLCCVFKTSAKRIKIKFDKVVDFILKQLDYSLLISKRRVD